MKYQKFTLLIAVIGSVAAVVANNSVNLGLCLKSQVACRTSYDIAEHIFYFFPILFIFSILTILIKSAWPYWWRFAKYAAPITFACVVAINFGVLHTNTYGTFGWGAVLNQTYDLWGLSLVYGVFVIGSLIQIIRGYQAGKRDGAVQQ